MPKYFLSDLFPISEKTKIKIGNKILKKCPHCKNIKFSYIRGNGKPYSWCIDCERERNKKWKEDNPEKRKKSQDEWRKKYYAVPENKKKKRAIDKRWQDANREKTRSYTKKHYKKNRDYILNKRKKDRANPEIGEKLRKYGREYVKNASKNLTKQYLKSRLVFDEGVPRESVTDDLVNQYKEHLTLVREIKTFKKEINNGPNL